MPIETNEDEEEDEIATMEVKKPLENKSIDLSAGKETSIRNRIREKYTTSSSGKKSVGLTDHLYRSARDTDKKKGSGISKQSLSNSYNSRQSDKGKSRTD